MNVEKLSLLIVDDSEDDLFFLENSLRQLGVNHDLHSRPCGDAAITYLNESIDCVQSRRCPAPNYIISDVRMTPGNGFELLTFMKEQPAFCDIPVYMLSGSDDPNDIRHCYLLGASGYFAKPAEPNELTLLVKSIHNFWMMGHSRHAELIYNFVDSFETGNQVTLAVADVGKRIPIVSPALS